MSLGLAAPPEAGARSSLISRIWWGPVWFGVGALLGSHALSDNSFLTHLATGRLILADGVPTRDPYSFLASGRPWVVQSWLASVMYAGSERAAGYWAIRMLIVVATGTLCALLWRLTRRIDLLLPRMVVTGAAVAFGSFWWNERPQLFGFALLAVTLVVIDERRSPWLLVPVFTVWVNVHGSFPVGLIVVGLWSAARWFGSSEDRRRLLAPVATGIAGCALGGLMSPYGVHQLTFPFSLLRRRDVLQYIVEWRRPALDEPSTWVFVLVVAVVMLLVVHARAWRWLPAVLVVAAMGAMSSRNIAFAALVLVPVAARFVPSFGSLPAPVRPARLGAALAIGVVLVVGAVLVSRSADTDFGPYPVAAVDWMQARHLVADPAVRVIGPDYVGNYLQWRFGARANTFVDDRAEVFEASEIADYVSLLTAEGDWSAVLDRYGADAVVWPRDAKLATLAVASGSWKVGYADRSFVVLCRTGTLLAC